MKKLTLLLAGALLFAMPHAASAAEQCTTGTLDLVCPEGEVLRGIKPSGSKICVTEGSGSGGGSFVALESGEVNHDDVILPINGYTRSQCILSLHGQPTKSDGAYKRGRHYGVWHSVSGSGWKVQAGHRYIQNNSLRLVTNAKIQYQLVCSGAPTPKVDVQKVDVSTSYKNRVACTPMPEGKTCRVSSATFRSSPSGNTDPYKQCSVVTGPFVASIWSEHKNIQLNDGPQLCAFASAYTPHLRPGQLIEYQSKSQRTGVDCSFVCE